MAYTGNWLKSAQQVQANPTVLPAPSERHGQDQSDQYPQDHMAPQGADYGGTDFARTVVQTPGLVLDTPTRDPGDTDRVSAPFATQAERQEYQALGHTGRDRGWVQSQYGNRQPWQDDTTRYMESRFEGAGSPAPPAEAVQRGINSLPQNNDGSIVGYDGLGWRRGYQRWRFIDRKNRIDPRNYTAQQLLARGITVPGDVPAQNGTWGKTSPFASMARNLSTVATSPGIFRNPPGLTDTILAGQAPATDDGGIAVDGMWATT